MQHSRMYFHPEGIYHLVSAEQAVATSSYFSLRQQTRLDP